jgi:hypothetical protein
VRGGREVDYGWFFMGTKRRQNYDDWWRCEVRFDPVLDEAFGITHTKQQIRPAPHLVQALSAFIEMMAKDLHARVRREYAAVAIPQAKLSAETDSEFYSACAALVHSTNSVQRYQFIEHPSEPQNLFRHATVGDTTVIGVGNQHPFYTMVYLPAMASGDHRLRAAVEGLLVSAAVGYREAARRSQSVAEEFRIGWSTLLAEQLGAIENA